MQGFKSLVASSGFGLLAVAPVVAAPASAEIAYDNPATAEGWAWSKIERSETADFNERCQVEPLDPRNIGTDSEKAWSAPCRALDARFIVDALSQASLRDRIPSKGLVISGARIVGDINLAHEKIARRLSIYKSRVEGRIDLDTAQVSDEVEFTDSRVDGKFSAAAGFNAEKEMHLEGSEFRDEVNFYYSNIDILLAMWGVLVEGPMNAEALKVEGDFSMAGAKFKCIANAESKCVTLDRAIVAGSLTMYQSTYQGMLSAVGLHVGDGLYMHGGAKFGKVVLSGASIASNLIMSDSIFNDEVDAFALHVGASVGMVGAKFTDRVNLAYATIGQNLDLRRATLASLDLHGATIAGELQLGVTGWPAKGEPVNLDLRNARVGTLVDDKDAWPDTGQLRLEGFSFAHLGGPGETHGPAPRDRGPEWWDEWARRDKGYSPYPYQQLAAAFTLAGDKDLADDIRYRSRVREYQTQRFPDWLWSWFLRWVAGFGIGTYPFRVLYWVGVISLAGALYLWKRAKGVRDKGHGFLWCWGASLARLLPVIEVNKEFTDFFNDPDRKNLTARENAAFSIMGVVGWFLAAILIAAVSGITGKS